MSLSIDHSSNIISLAESIKNKSIHESNSLKFMSRLLVMVNLPYKAPAKNSITWSRSNGKIRINVTSGFIDNDPIGIPYGIYPRLILSYIITQAVKKQSPNIYLGKSFYEFINSLNINRGGKQYEIIHTQMSKLLSSSFSWNETPEDMNAINSSSFHFGSSFKLWWPPQVFEKKKLKECFVTLNQDFYNDIINSPVPIDLRIMSELKNYPMALDIYMFLIWRTYNLKKGFYISWENLKYQIGHQYKCLKEFARHCRKYIEMIKFLCPKMNIQVLKGRIYISPPSI